MTAAIANKKAMPYKIAALISWYNDVKGLERLMTSLKPGNFDLIVAVDGRYPHYGTDEEDKALSTDGSREYLRSLSRDKGDRHTKIVILDKPDYEHRKRQAYLDYLYAHNWRGFSLIIDSDEYIDNKLTDFDQFYAELVATCDHEYNRAWNVYNVQVATADPGYVDTLKALHPDQQHLYQRPTPYQWMPRLWRNAGDLAYFLNHYNYRVRDPTHPHHADLTEPAKADVKGLWIRHDHTLRSQIDIHKRIQYQKWLMELEQDIIPWYYRRYKTLPDNLEECVLAHAKHQEERYAMYEPQKCNPQRIALLEQEVQKYHTRYAITSK